MHDHNSNRIAALIVIVLVLLSLCCCCAITAVYLESETQFFSNMLGSLPVIPTAG